MTREEAAEAVNLARAARDAAFQRDPLSEDTASAYMALGSAYRRLANRTSDVVSQTAMHEAADAMALLAANLRMVGAGSYSAGDEVEWNPTGDVWVKATVQFVLDEDHVTLNLSDGSGQILRVETRHIQRAGGGS